MSKILLVCVCASMCVCDTISIKVTWSRSDLFSDVTRRNLLLVHLSGVDQMN